MKAWAGLGYYSRARNLHACAKAVVEQHGGALSRRRRTALRALPGIGAYTPAPSPRSPSTGRAAVVDGNVERVIARLFAIETPLPRRQAADPRARRRRADAASRGRAISRRR